MVRLRSEVGLRPTVSPGVPWRWGREIGEIPLTTRTVMRTGKARLRCVRDIFFTLVSRTLTAIIQPIRWLRGRLQRVRSVTNTHKLFASLPVA